MGLLMVLAGLLLQWGRPFPARMRIPVPVGAEAMQRKNKGDLFPLLEVAGIVDEEFPARLWFNRAASLSH